MKILAQIGLLLTSTTVAPLTGMAAAQDSFGEYYPVATGYSWSYVDKQVPACPTLVIASWTTDLSQGATTSAMVNRVWAAAISCVSTTLSAVTSNGINSVPIAPFSVVRR